VPRHPTVFLDMDSTLAGVEGIDFLAARRGPDVAAEVAAMTERAMQGAVALDAVYGERMARVAPGRDDLAALATAYRDTLAPGAERAVARLRAAGVYVAVVSGGLRQAIVPVARTLGLTLGDVHAVDVVTDGGGRYVGYDAGSPLVTQDGKAAVVREALAARGPAAHPALAVGDGSTDVAMRGAGLCAAFAAYTGFTRRDAVVARADHVLADFDALAALVLGDDA
jgi:phosphoserine phosphatase